MPEHDCGLCDLLINCGGHVITKEQYQTLVAKLLCEGVDTLAEFVAIATGGAQYTEGDVDATITGNAILWEDVADTLRAVSAANPLPVDGSGVTQPVQIVYPTTPLDAQDNQAVAQTDTVLQATPGIGLRFYVTDVILSNGATIGSIKLVENTGGGPSTDITPPLYFGVNGGTHFQFNTPIRTSLNVDLGYTSVLVTTHGVKVLGYVGP